MAAPIDAAKVPKQEASKEQTPSESSEELVRPSAEELEVARELVRSARERGTALTGRTGF